MDDGHIDHYDSENTSLALYWLEIYLMYDSKEFIYNHKALIRLAT